MIDSRKYKVLILSTRDWFGSARLPRALARVGFEVSSLSFHEALVTKSRHLCQRFPLRDGETDAKLLAAIRETLSDYAPDVVVPGDDPAVELLHALGAELGSVPDDPVLACLRRSLGDPAHYAETQSRRALHRVASELGVRAPAQGIVHDPTEAEAFAARHGFPIVLKAENTCAGFGTRICKDQAALAEAFAYFDGRFRPSDRTKRQVTVQEFIAGRTAMRAIVASGGEVLGGLSAIKTETHPAPTGPSCVVDFFEHEEMAATVVAVTRAFGIAGFASFDFMIEDATNAAYLIELNPRPTPICHLGGAFGDDLAGALWQRLSSSPPLVNAAADARRRVALFPQEWIRSQESPYLAQAFHDVPWDDPALVRALVATALEHLDWERMSSEDKRRSSIRKLYSNE